MVVVFQPLTARLTSFARALPNGGLPRLVGIVFDSDSQTLAASPQDVFFPGHISDVLLSYWRLARNLDEPSADKHDQEAGGGYPVAELEPTARVTNPANEPEKPIEKLDGQADTSKLHDPVRIAQRGLEEQRSSLNYPTHGQNQSDNHRHRKHRELEKQTDERQQSTSDTEDG